MLVCKKFFTGLVLALSLSTLCAEDLEMQENNLEYASEKQCKSTFPATDLMIKHYEEKVPSDQITPTKKSSQKNQTYPALGKNSGCLVIGGTFKQDGVCSVNPVLLNKAFDADRYMFVRQTLDLDIDHYNNAENINDSAIQFHSTVRQKSYWGDVFKTGAADVLSSSGASHSKHSHDITKPLIWAKDLWLKVSLDKTLNKNLGKNNSVEMTSGFFPYQLGRGISLGSGYGTSKEFLGVYNRVSDFSAPGILLSTKLVDGRLKFDIYWALLEADSVSPKQTMESAREKVVGYRLNPWAGSGNDDQLFALQMDYKFKDFKVGNRKAAFRFYDYVMYALSPAKKIEVKHDCDSDLMTFGSGFEGSVCRLEFGFEGALNFGQEKLYNIDRNSKKEVTDDNGSKVDQYSHIERQDGANWVPAVATKDLADALNANTDFANPIGGQTYRSKANRMRPSFTNYFRGWMVVADAAINFESSYGKIKPAFACGIVSGDADPNKIEKDKDYKGFVGLHECYSGTRVKSVIMLSDRNISRPMTILEDDKLDKPSKKSDGSFVDLRFVGYGLSIKPKRWENNACVLDFNLLGFWKDHASKAYDAQTKSASTKDAQRYLGTEGNMSLKFDVVENLSFGITAAVMLPGGYYKDIAGARISGDAMSALEEADTAGLDTAPYRIGSDATYFFSTSLAYKF